MIKIKFFAEMKIGEVITKDSALIEIDAGATPEQIKSAIDAAKLKLNMECPFPNG